jgi:hypothetical protein
MSTSSRRIAPGGWRCIGFSYDGERIVSHLDGIPDERPRQTDYQGATYSRNPYFFSGPLNPDSRADFTVGANRVGAKVGPGNHTDGIGLFYAGMLGGLAVWDRALDAPEILRVHRMAADDALHRFDFSGGTFDHPQDAEEFGWRSARGRHAQDTSRSRDSGNFQVMHAGRNGFLYRTASGIPENRAEPGIGYFDQLGGLQASEVGAIRFRMNHQLGADGVRLCLRIDGAWYATAETFAVRGDGRGGFDWTRSADISWPMTRDPGVWRALRFEVDRILELGEIVDAGVPDGELTALGFLSTGLAEERSVLRITDIEVVDAVRRSK